MSKRVSKKLVPDLADLDGAILLVNGIDPQIETVRIFQEAVEELPHFIIINKVDAIVLTKAQAIADQFRDEIVLFASLTEKRGVNGIKTELARLPKGKVAVLGIFNSGKTTLINELTGTYDTVSDLPGTTLKFTPRQYEGWTLIDTVGQVIDVNRPMMVSIDFNGCNTLEEKVLRVLAEDRDAVTKSIGIVVPQIVQAIRLIQQQLSEGGKILLAGAGASALVAMEMAGQGQETGLPIVVFTNNFATCQPVSFAKGFGEEELAVAEYNALSVNFGDVAIGVSASGGTGFVTEFLRISRQKGAKTIAITENADTPMGKQADIIIKSEAKPEGPSSSKIQAAHLAIGHALILSLADERGISAQQSVDFMLPKRVPNKKMGIK